MPHRLNVALVALALGFAGCGDDDAEPSSEATEPAREATAEPEGAAEQAPAEPEAPSLEGAAGGIAWRAPEPFRPVQPSAPMRTAEYVFPEQAGERPATLTVFFFGEGRGGSIDENVQRWVAQFRNPDGSESEAEITQRQVNDLTVTLVDARGTYTAMTPMGHQGPPQTGQRLLGAIVQAPEAPVFFKMVGPESVMERAQPAFEALVESIHMR